MTAKRNRAAGDALAGVIAAAVRLAECGAFVVPCHFPRPDGNCSCGEEGHHRDVPKSSCGKHPVGSGWGDRASTDPPTVRRLFTEAAESLDGVPNVSIVTTQRTRTLALDVDSDEGERVLAELSGGELPPTWEDRSGKGRHLLFRIPDGVAPKLVQFKDANGEEALRILCGPNKQVVACPSVHHSGRRYEWAAGRAPWEVPLADMPRWLIHLTCPPERKTDVGGADPDAPGNDFNRKCDFGELLTAAEWTKAGGGKEVSYWCRPGKGSYGATLGHCTTRVGTPALYVFHGGVPYLDSDKSYDAFGFLAHWKYRGDFAACAKALGNGDFDGTRYGRQDPSAGFSGRNGKHEPTDSIDPRKEIVLGTDEHRVNDQVAAELAGDPDLYTRGTQIVQAVQTEDGPIDPDAVVRRMPGTPTVRAVSKPVLRDHISRRCRFVRQRRTNEGDEIRTPAHPPGWTVDANHARGGCGFRPLVGLATHPMLLDNGRILAANGYDRGSGLLACMPPGLTVSVPDSPTRTDVARAVAALFDVLHDFPFETPAHRSAVLAGLLTPLAYYAFEGPTPLFLIDGNIRGVGKGLLADVLALILTGRRFSVMSYSHDQDELRKRITTLAIEAERLVLLDNLTGAFGNGVLDAALTSDRWKDRILGGNAGYDGPLHVVWYGTGNNVQIVGDTARRICPARLESPDARPETKDGFRYPKLRDHVRDNRGPLLSAALTILRGWFVAGRPQHRLRAWGSFEGWGSVIREALVFAGLPDPADTREALQASSDRESLCMEVIVSHLNSFDTSDSRRGVTATDVVKKLRESSGFQSDRDAEMQSAIEELCGRLDARLLGYKFRSFKRRNFNGQMLDLAGEDRMKGNRWRAVPVGGNFHRCNPPDAGDAGDAGDVSPRQKTPGGGQVTPDAGDAGDAGDVPAQLKTATRRKKSKPPADPDPETDTAALIAAVWKAGWTAAQAVEWLEAQDEYVPLADLAGTHGGQRRKLLAHLAGLRKGAK